MQPRFLPKKLLKFHAKYDDRVIAFSARTISINSKKLYLELTYPDKIYEALDRNAPRLDFIPHNLSITIMKKIAGDLTALDVKPIDFSLTGVLFQGNSAVLSDQTNNDEQTFRIVFETHARKVECNAKLVRTFLKHDISYFACVFAGMSDEDSQYLFDYVYGKLFTDIFERLKNKKKD
jgi:hypothetical protein